VHSKKRRVHVAQGRRGRDTAGATHLAFVAWVAAVTV
jgi:hypothetical protein